MVMFCAFWSRGIIMGMKFKIKLEVISIEPNITDDSSSLPSQGDANLFALLHALHHHGIQHRGEQ